MHWRKSQGKNDSTTGLVASIPAVTAPHYVAINPLRRSGAAIHLFPYLKLHIHAAGRQIYEGEEATIQEEGAGTRWSAGNEMVEMMLIGQ